MELPTCLQVLLFLLGIMQLLVRLVLRLWHLSPFMCVSGFDVTTMSSNEASMKAEAKCYEWIGYLDPCNVARVDSR